MKNGKTMINKFKIFEEHKLEKNQYQLLEYIDDLSSSNTFIFLDTETTGLGGFKKQQLTQISAVAADYDFNNNKYSGKTKGCPGGFFKWDYIENFLTSSLIIFDTEPERIYNIHKIKEGV